MKNSLVGKVLSRSLVAAALSVSLSAGTAAVAVFSASPASAEVTAGDFIDPATGQVDLAAYLAAVSASKSGLPSTGSNSLELAAGGVAIAAAGGAAIVLSKRGKNRTSA
jgi:LPXTG-motif cell wall-anchored protein